MSTAETAESLANHTEKLSTGLWALKSEPWTEGTVWRDRAVGIASHLWGSAVPGSWDAQGTLSLGRSGLASDENSSGVQD